MHHPIRKPVLLLGLLLLVGFPWQLAAQAGYKPMADVPAFEQSLAKAVANTSTIQSDFVQESTLAVLSDKVVATGRFYFKRENQVRWAYASPKAYHVVLSSAGMRITQNGKTQQYNVGGNKAFQQIHGLMSASLQGNLAAAAKDYNLRYLEGPAQYLVKLTPKHKNGRDLFAAIAVYLDRKTFTVNELHLTDATGDVIAIRFSNKRLNLPLENGLFSAR